VSTRDENITLVWFSRHAARPQLSLAVSHPERRRRCDTTTQLTHGAVRRERRCAWREKKGGGGEKEDKKKKGGGRGRVGHRWERHTLRVSALRVFRRGRWRSPLWSLKTLAGDRTDHPRRPAAAAVLRLHPYRPLSCAAQLDEDALPSCHHSVPDRISHRSRGESRPPEASRASIAFVHDAGLPIRIVGRDLSDGLVAPLGRTPRRLHRLPGTVLFGVLVAFPAARSSV